MKINKLLLFLLALVSLNSCVEYVDNGTQPDGPEKPEEQVFVAKLSEESEGEFVGDEFIFEATLNGVDVTSATTFKVNGVDAKGNVFKAIKEGENAVLATMDDFTSTFRFTVKEKGEEEPEEPTGNRIEYDGDSYPVSKTEWGLILDGDNLYTMPINNITHAVWYMTSYEMDSSNKILHQFVTLVAMPVNSQGQALLPYADSSLLVHIGGALTLDGTPVFEESSNVVYTFAATGNEQPNAQNIGTANYTGLITDDASTDTAELFWNGNYSFSTPDISEFSKAKKAKNNIDINKLKNIKGLH